MRKFVKKLAVALLAAAAIAAGTLSVSAADTGWKRDNIGWWYSYSSGEYARDGWEKVDNIWYYFDHSGYMRTGWILDNGNWYYLDNSGAMKTGWVLDSGNWYYLDGSGAMKTGWVQDNGNWYYLDGSGRMLSDRMLTLSGVTYYLGATGAMFTGTMAYNGETLTFDSNGALQEAGETSDSGKTLIVYYSATGNTEEAANYIARATGGDLFELEPVDPYTSADLNYSNQNSRVVYEHDNPSAQKIELVADTVAHWEEYDTVFIGYPIWWGIAAWPVNGFVEGNDFTEKTVIPFATSASSGLGQSGRLLEEMAGTGNWLEGRRFSSWVSENEVRSWIEGLNW